MAGLLLLIPAFITFIIILPGKTREGIFPQLVLGRFDSSDALDLHFPHTRRPMSALSNIFSLPGLSGYRLAI